MKYDDQALTTWRSVYRRDMTVQTMSPEEYSAWAAVGRPDLGEPADPPSELLLEALSDALAVVEREVRDEFANSMKAQIDQLRSEFALERAKMQDEITALRREVDTHSGGMEFARSILSGRITPLPSRPASANSA